MTSSDPTANEDAFLAAGLALAASLDARLPGYVAELMMERTPNEISSASPAYREEIARVAEEATERCRQSLENLVRADIDAQTTTPLEVVRGFVPAATEFLARHEVPPVVRDRFIETRFPRDIYHLTPTNLAQLGDDIGELAIVWGATKAFVHKQRHRAEPVD